MVYKCIPSAPFVLQSLPGVATGRLHLLPLISIVKVRLLSKWTILFDIYKNYSSWIWTLSLSVFQKRMNFNSLLSAVVFLLSSFHHVTSRGKNLWKSGVVNISANNFLYKSLMFTFSITLCSDIVHKMWRLTNMYSQELSHNSLQCQMFQCHFVYCVLEKK